MLLVVAADGSSAVAVVLWMLSIVASVMVIRREYREKIGRSLPVLALVGMVGGASASFIKVFYAQAFRIPTSSMEPALEAQDYVIASKPAYRSSEPRRGDIVIFKFPPDPTSDHVKRVVGLPGETIEIGHRAILVDGRPLEDPWGVSIDGRSWRATAAGVDGLGPLVVPDDAYFVLGDNRNRSADSRDFGCVPRDLLVGKVMIRYLPLSRLGRVR